MRIAMTRRGLSRLAAQMGAEKVGRLIAFYEGEDFGRFAALTTRLEQGEGLSTDEQAELDRIGAAYPVYEFAERMQTDLPSAMADAITFDARSRCGDEKAAALERLGLQLAPEDVPDDSADPVPAEESPS